jgi:hypothetical protein
VAEIKEPAFALRPMTAGGDVVIIYFSYIGGLQAQKIHY